jgi:hypothetical protein
MGHSFKVFFNKNIMTIIDKLASSLGRRDKIPNQELAKEIAAGNNKKAVKEVVENLNNKSRDIQGDCIKVVYEIGRLNPGLIADYYKELLALLDSRNNRLQWGSMSALNSITNEVPEVIYKSLGKIVDAADKGTVITNDHCVGILIKLCAIKKYAEDAFSLLNERLKDCPVNQLPMYAEMALPVINDKNKATFGETLQSRMGDIGMDTKRKRVEKVIRKLA